LSWEEKLIELRKPTVRAQLLAESPQSENMFELFVTQSFNKMYELSKTGYEPRLDENLSSRAARLAVSPAELAYDLLLERDGTNFIYFPLFNYSDGNLDVLHELHQHPNVLMGLSDGGAHCGAVCDGGMPTFMLTHWTRDRDRGEKLPLSFIIHRQTQQTAEFYGLNDRGLLKVGYRADINLIDYDELALDLPEMVFDLPAGGRRLLQRARGYRATVCAGQVTFNNGKPTGALPGGLIRGSQPSPEVLSPSINVNVSEEVQPAHIGRTLG
jgi:N-acyl-D-aspartate/D-glutamate deacylase